eukprot:TRINITY_DN6179_c0_g3_i1.p1 TRINITY_DN6179_c0_g3~~TRINITY_DN6179_c0_g3_i1.p1  ORF type:complete len:111 (-),score=39.46 TRINITY_DN6179_c0_g3_i1:142-474(-)
MASVEEKVSAAETRVAAVEEQLAKIASSLADAPAASSSDSAALREYQFKILEELRTLRIHLGAARREHQQVTAERDQAVAQVKQLQTDKIKLEYRVKHLIRSLEAEEAKH